MFWRTVWIGVLWSLYKTESSRSSPNLFSQISGGNQVVYCHCFKILQISLQSVPREKFCALSYGPKSLGFRQCGPTTVLLVLSVSSPCFSILTSPRVSESHWSRNQGAGHGYLRHLGGGEQIEIGKQDRPFPRGERPPWPLQSLRDKYKEQIPPGDP